ncbi:MAG: response regulator transcription factor [Oscillospiraceae bacterium]|nr:response regulator transcription factor [Oscillospiraceae bacterium]
MMRLCLEKEGYSVMIALDGGEGLTQFSALKPDLVLLEVTPPSVDGWQVCREIRKKSDIPIIFITSKSEIFDKVLGLELGADDYIVKPFDTREVVARVKAVLRRYGLSKPSEPKKEIHYESLDIDMNRYELKVKGEIIPTPPKELELLYYMASHPNTVFNRDQLLDEVWGYDYYGSSRTIDVHIKRLRKKIDGVSEHWKLTTVWSVGYKFELTESGSSDSGNEQERKKP